MVVSLRCLNEKDAQLMLEWMHDEAVVSKLQKPFRNMTIEDALKFIGSASYELVDGNSLHYAIVNEQDEYLGSISLKNLDLKAKNAEYAVAMRSGFHGQGIGTQATKLLLEKAFNELNLERVYLNVLSVNSHARHMYERCGFQYEGCFRKHICREGES